MEEEKNYEFEQDGDSDLYVESGTVSRFISKAIGWMVIFLGVTALSAYIVSNTIIIKLVLHDSITFFILFAAKLGIVFYLSRNIHSLKPLTAKILTLTLSILFGVTLSSLFFVGIMDLVILALILTLVSFSIMAIYGYFTKNDLSSLSSILINGLMFLFIVGIAQIFIVKMDQFELLIASFGALLFMVYTAYDIQKIKKTAIRYGYMEDDELESYAIIGALELYLDFLNLFRYILRILILLSRKNKK